MHARSSQEASHVRRRTRCASKVCHCRRARQVGHDRVETCPFWPWLYALLVPAGIGFHLAHAKQLRAIAAAPQKSDAVDARLLARMLLAGLIPEAYPRPADQRDLLRLLRHRTTLVRYRTRLGSRARTVGSARNRRASPAGETLGPLRAVSIP